MSAAIMNALNDLHVAMEGLEKAAGKQEQSMLKLKQQDLFGGAAPQAKKVANDSLVSKLDNAIEKVEKILKEG